MADIVYAVDGYVDAGYFVYTADAGAGLVATSVVSQDPYVVIDYLVPDYVLGRELNATVIKTAVGALVSESSTTASANLTRSTSATLDGVAITLTAAGRLRPFGADLSCTSSVSASANLIHDAGLVKPRVTWDDQISWDTWFRTVWDPSEQVGIILPAYARLNADPKSNRDFTFDGNVTATLSAAAMKILNASSTLTSSSTVNASGEKYRQAAADVSSSFDLSVELTRQVAGDASISSVSSLSAQPIKVVPASASITSTAELSATSNRIKSATAALSAFDTVVGAVARIRGFGADLSVTASASIQAVKTARSTSALSASANVTASGIALAANRASFETAAQLAATPTRIRPGVSALSGAFTQNALAGFRADASASLQAFDFVLSTGRKLPIKIDYQLRVSQETKILSVLIEPRVLTVAEETRLNTVQAESRDLYVPEETRVYSVI